MLEVGGHHPLFWKKGNQESGIIYYFINFAHSTVMLASPLPSLLIALSLIFFARYWIWNLLKIFSCVSSPYQLWNDAKMWAITKSQIGLGWVYVFGTNDKTMSNTKTILSNKIIWAQRFAYYLSTKYYSLHSANGSGVITEQFHDTYREIF